MKTSVGPALAGRRSHDRPRHAVVKRQQIGGDESRARRIDVAIPLRMLAVREETLRRDEMQTVFCACHGDIEQSALLFYLCCGSRREVRRDAAVHGVEHENGLPFLPLGGMNGGEDEIVLVAQRRSGPTAGCVRRIERQFGQEAFARRIARSDLLELNEIVEAGRGVFV